MMKKLETIIIRVLETLISLGILAILVIVVVQVVLSSCFGSSITGANEIVTKLFVYVTSVGAAVAVGREEHVAIKFATDALPRSGRRATEILALVLVAILNMVVVVYSVHWIRVTGHYLMPTTQLPRMLAQFSQPIGSSLAVVFCLLRLCRRANRTAGSEALS